MKLEISKEELVALEIQHKKERDGRVRDRIKVVLLRSEGWMHSQIAQALRIRIETVQEHLNDYVRSKKLKPENGGSESKLTEGQTSELVQHLYANKLKISGFGARYFGSFYAWQNHRKCRRHYLDFATQKSLEISSLQNQVSSACLRIEALNKEYRAIREKLGSKAPLFALIRSALQFFMITNFEKLYQCILTGPPVVVRL